MTFEADVLLKTYDGGFSEKPHCEAHCKQSRNFCVELRSCSLCLTAGLTYCAVDALSFLGRIQHSRLEDARLPDLAGISLESSVRWMLDRQTTYLEEVDEYNEESGDLANIDTDSGPVSGSPSRPPQQTSTPATFLPHIGALYIDERPRASPPTINLREEDLRWAGFNGRHNKVADTCYCFWNTGAIAVRRLLVLECLNANQMQILGRIHLVERVKLRRYLLEKVQHIVGGFGKGIGDPPGMGLCFGVVRSVEGLTMIQRHPTCLPWPCRAGPAGRTGHQEH